MMTLRPPPPCRLVALGWAVLLGLLPATTARAEEDGLAPTPARSPEEVVRIMVQRGPGEIQLADEERRPRKESLAGALTGLGGGRAGFMPLLQHHMAVEHWFLEGLTRQKLGRWPDRGERLYVRLSGTVELQRQWGHGTDFYGNGLEHGRAWGPVMGYHERLYRFAVDSVDWVRTPAEFQELAKRYQAQREIVEHAIAAEDWSAALAAQGVARALKDDVGALHTEDLETPLEALVLVASGPESWTDEDVGTIADAFVSDMPGAVSKQAVPYVRRVATTWPAPSRERLAAAIVSRYETLAYRHQREALRKGVLAALGGKSVEDLESRIAAAQARLGALKDRLAAEVAAHAYEAAHAVWEEIDPEQALVLDYALSNPGARMARDALERCRALEAAWTDPARRMDTLARLVREAVASGEDLPNNDYRPRFPQELVEHFFPRLTGRESRRVEALLVEIGTTLDPEEAWAGSLVVAELLSGVGGEAARRFFPGFLARRTHRPAWQREYLQRFHEIVKAR